MVPGAPEQRSGWEHKAKALGAAWAKATSRRRHGGHQSKVIASASTCVNVSLECCKVVS
jgi:hypothetical protein